MRLANDRLALSFLASVLFPVLAGCSSDFAPQTSNTPIQSKLGALQGVVYGGQQPISGSHLYVFAAGTGGYGGPSVPLLNNVTTGSYPTTYDPVLKAYYVTTGSTGNFSLSSDYSCMAGQQVYLYAQGGNPGLSATAQNPTPNNSAIGLMAVIGQCPSTGTLAATVPNVTLNEATTIAAAYAMAGFAVDATDISDDEAVAGNTTATQAQAGMANAFANAGDLVNVVTGVARSVTPGNTNGTVPLQEINSLANALAACVSSSGPSSGQCNTLLTTALSNGASGTQPTDTATAAINIAHNPANAVTTIYGLPTGTSAPFQPALTGATGPKDWTVVMSFSGGASSNGNGSPPLAVDGMGNVWFCQSNSTVSELSSLGTFLSGANGYLDSNNRWCHSVAIDLNGDAWVANSTNRTVSEFSSSGSVLSTAGGDSFETNPSVPVSIAVDGYNQIWIGISGLANSTGVAELSNSGSILSPATGIPIAAVCGTQACFVSDPAGIAVDPSENIWIANFAGNVIELNNSGATVSPAGGDKNGGVGAGIGPAIDASGNFWEANYGTATISELSPSGSGLSPSTGYTGGGIIDANGLSIDGAGHVWVASFDEYTNAGVAELSNSGSAISPSTGYGSSVISSGNGIAVDGSGNVWVAQSGNIAELVGAATPVVTPLAVGVKYAKLGTRP